MKLDLRIISHLAILRPLRRCQIRQIVLSSVFCGLFTFLVYSYVFFDRDADGSSALTKKVLQHYLEFDSLDVTPENSRPDPKLIDKILAGSSELRTPVFLLKSSKSDVKTIPKIVHLSWKTEEVPSRATKWLEKWPLYHKKWVYLFWTDKSARKFVKTHYNWLLKYYDSWTVPVQRSDMFRILVVYAFGGIWADLDIEPLKSLEPVLKWSGCVISRNSDIQNILIDKNPYAINYGNNFTYTVNAFFGCRPAHPFLFYNLIRVIYNAPEYTKKDCHIIRTVLCSGPNLMSHALAFYQRSIPDTLRRLHRDMDVVVPHSDYFMPTFDTKNLRLIEKTCSDPPTDQADELCKQWHDGMIENEPKTISFTHHHWLHTYNPRDFGFVNVRKHLDIKTFFDDDLFQVFDVNSFS